MPHRRAAAAVKAAKSNPLASVILATLVILSIGVWTISYIERRDARSNRYDERIITARLRWQATRRAAIDANREYVLAGHSKGVVAKVHLSSANAAQQTAISLNEVTAPTEKRREAMCNRLNPPPSIVG